MSRWRLVRGDRRGGCPGFPGLPGLPGFRIRCGLRLLGLPGGLGLAGLLGFRLGHGDAEPGQVGHLVGGQEPVHVHHQLDRLVDQGHARQALVGEVVAQGAAGLDGFRGDVQHVGDRLHDQPHLDRAAAAARVDDHDARLLGVGLGRQLELAPQVHHGHVLVAQADHPAHRLRCARHRLDRGQADDLLHAPHVEREVLPAQAEGQVLALQQAPHVRGGDA